MSSKLASIPYLLTTANTATAAEAAIAIAIADAAATSIGGGGVTMTNYERLHSTPSISP